MAQPVAALSEMDWGAGSRPEAVAVAAVAAVVVAVAPAVVPAVVPVADSAL